KLLQSLWIAATKESVAALLEADASLVHAVGEPVVLVQADASREGEVGADADEHASELPVVQIEVVLVDPAGFELKMAASFLLADADENLGGLSGFENGDDLVWACVSEVAFHEFIPPVAGIVQDRSVPGKRAVGDPVLVLVCDVAETIPGDRVDVPIGAEEADDSLGLLKGLDGSIEQDSIKAAIMETDVILMVLKEGVHGESSSGFAFAGRIILTDAFAISRG